MADHPLHIAMVAPPWYEVPPKGYGGIEQLVGDLVQNLLHMGNEVTLIGAGETGTDAKYLQTMAQAPSDRIGESLPEVLHAALAAKELEFSDVDVVHDHSLAGPLTAAARQVPTLVTVHGPVSEEEELGDLYAALDDSVELVAISEAQRSFRPQLNWVATVHNGIDVSDFPYQDGKEDYVLFLGRMSHDKGVHLAIDAAKTAKQRLVIAAKCTDDLEKEYFHEYVEPRLWAGVEYVGEANGPWKRELLRKARCLLLPLLWEEPFGLVMIEALACGTPVVALRRGSVPEVVIDGVTGLICDKPEDLPAALNQVDRIDPAHCRRDAERRFDMSVIARKYEHVYRTLV